ncbi:MAG: sodium:alanine symporter family protein [Fusobacterium sp.]|uniref:alanine/glycine:cation symporter family protein n=1 Tax=Fusobacterium mortiferum TaxID=850 RepID=UPI00195B3BCE|nr:sodium:alanine symporter family protein [Fusobacterium sp.]MBM6690607.1 sodium:alanine symporter family protein [Fusobacterium mortiferum]MDO5789238.1 sodium:alanine symporter family protein [Fusobacterium sp.]
MQEIVAKINEFLWGNFLIILLLGTGIYFTFKLNFIQLRKFSEGIKQVTGSVNLKGKSADRNGMSSFQALATAIAAQVGTGNLAGAATAIVSGGPGAIFWMWVSAFFGMSTVYVEAILGQVFKRRVNGQVTGGPAYYIEESLKSRKLSKGLAIFFSVACILALGLMGNAVQANSISVAFNSAFGVSPLLIGVIVSILSGFVFFGGIKRIASVTEKIVPIMAGLYILACVIIIVINYKEIIPAISSIFVSAFNPKAALGGALGVSMKQAIRYGVARGLFSNEAGMGSTPHAHAIAKVEHCGEQGIVAMITVFIDTFVVLTGTALVIITSNVSEGEGIVLTQNAFIKSLGSYGDVFIAICLFFFAFSTIIGWYFFGEANVRYLFKSKYSINIYRAIVMIMIVIGSTLKVGLIWEIADMFNGMMVLPNLIALLALGKYARTSMKEYEELLPQLV